MAEGKAVPVTIPPVEDGVEKREDIYKKYAEQNGGVPEEPKETAAPEEAKPAEADKPVEAEKTAAEPEKEEAQDKPKEEKTVPYNALHEERLKRQAETKLRKELEARAKALEDEVNKLKATDTQPVEITDYEKELIDHKQKLQAIETVLAREQKEKVESTERENRKKFESIMEEIDSELKTEGVAGFLLAKVQVADEVKRLLLEDEANAIIDNKEGWKKIYKESFYPKFRDEFLSVEKAREKSEKTELKKGAALGNIPGKAPEKPKSVDNLTPDQMRERYMEERRARQL
jgi:hypothetical protein